jgi:hypothetical protein
MSLFETGMPARWFAPWRAVAAGLFVAGAVQIVNEVGARLTRWYDELVTAPACYDAGKRHHASGTRPIPPYGERDVGGRGIDDRGASFDSDLDKLTLAQQACTPTACSRDAWKAYNSAIFWYVSARLQHTTRLDRDYGDEGLARARAVYGTPLDRQIEAGLVARYRARIFRINDFNQNRDAIAILILAGGNALRPCRDTDAAR